MPDGISSMASFSLDRPTYLRRTSQLSVSYREKSLRFVTKIIICNLFCQGITQQSRISRPTARGSPAKSCPESLMGKHFSRSCCSCFLRSNS